MAKRIVMLGPPGSGKGTQARRLVRNHGVPQISTGDIFRSHVERKTNIGKRIADIMGRGELVPDRLTCEIVASRLTEKDCAEGYILDGFPRTMGQASELDRIQEGRQERLDVAVALDVPDELIVERLTNRRTCSKCGRIFNLVSKPPATAGQCDKPECEGAPLEQRDDDKEDTIRGRLRVYHENTEPVLAFYTQSGILKTVRDATGTPDEIAEIVEEFLSSTTEAPVQ